MSFWSLYAFVMIVQLCRKRFNSAKALAAGLFVGIAHAVVFELGDFGSSAPVIFYSAMFLISFGWFCLLDFLQLKLSAIFSGFLVAFQIVMVFNSLGGNVPNSMLYVAYPYIIMVINILMIGAALGERDDMASNHSHSHCSHKGNDKSKGAA